MEPRLIVVVVFVVCVSYACALGITRALFRWRNKCRSGGTHDPRPMDSDPACRGSVCLKCRYGIMRLDGPRQPWFETTNEPFSDDFMLLREKLAAELERIAACQPTEGELQQVREYRRDNPRSEDKPRGTDA